MAERKLDPLHLKFKDLFFFALQDRGQDEVTSKAFNGLPFKANFADGIPGLGSINDMPGTDGFVMSVDPLFSVSQPRILHSTGPRTILKVDGMTIHFKL